jgi:hypothetical protein
MRKWDFPVAASMLVGALVIVQMVVLAFETMAAPV